MQLKNWRDFCLIFTWKLRLSSVDSRKLTELEVGRMTLREEVRPWPRLTSTWLLTHWAV